MPVAATVRLPGLFRRGSLRNTITQSVQPGAAMRIDEMIAAVQHVLGITVDGKAGPQTWGAIHARLVGNDAGAGTPDRGFTPVDARSEKTIRTLLPRVQPVARVLVQKAASVGIRIKVLAGLRDHAEQDALYARGRTTPGSIVTNARAGYSSHNFGIAFDIGVFEGNRYLQESPKYQAVGALGTDLGLEWGGNWKSIVDQSHFQLRPAWAAGLDERRMLAGLRARRAQGAPIYA